MNSIVERMGESMKYAIVLMVGLIGSATASAQLPKDMAKDRVLAGLRFEAKKHHVYWYVICVPANDGEGQHYNAYADLDNVPRDAIYIEDGAKPYWGQEGQTGLEAAYNLYLALANNRPPNIQPDHAPGHKGTAKCHYNVVYDSEHEGEIPCTE